jgi:hypothetical protein
MKCVLFTLAASLSPLSVAGIKIRDLPVQDNAGCNDDIPLCGEGTEWSTADKCEIIGGDDDAADALGVYYHEPPPYVAFDMPPEALAACTADPNCASIVGVINGFPLSDAGITVRGSVQLAGLPESDTTLTLEVWPMSERTSAEYRAAEMTFWNAQIANNECVLRYLPGQTTTSYQFMTNQDVQKSTWGVHHACLVSDIVFPPGFKTILFNSFYGYYALKGAHIKFPDGFSTVSLGSFGYSNVVKLTFGTSTVSEPLQLLKNSLAGLAACNVVDFGSDDDGPINLGGPSTNIGDGTVFSGTPIEDLVINERIQKFGYRCFQNNRMLRSITLPKDGPWHAVSNPQGRLYGPESETVFDNSGTWVHKTTGVPLRDPVTGLVTYLSASPIQDAQISITSPDYIFYPMLCENIKPADGWQDITGRSECMWVNWALKMDLKCEVIVENALPGGRDVALLYSKTNLYPCPGWE